jgi:hypothetical protein
MWFQNWAKRLFRRAAFMPLKCANDNDLVVSHTFFPSTLKRRERRAPVRIGLN